MFILLRHQIMSARLLCRWTVALRPPASECARLKLLRPFSVCRPARKDDMGDFMKGITPDQFKEIMQNPVIAKLARAPRSQAVLKETTTLLASKGYSQQMGPMKQLKLIFDKDVREKMRELKQVMDEEDVVLREEDMTSLYKILGIKNEN